MRNTKLGGRSGANARADLSGPLSDPFGRTGRFQQYLLTLHDEERRHIEAAERRYVPRNRIEDEFLTEICEDQLFGYADTLDGERN